MPVEEDMLRVGRGHSHLVFVPFKYHEMCSLRNILSYQINDDDTFSLKYERSNLCCLGVEEPNTLKC